MFCYLHSMKEQKIDLHKFYKNIYKKVLTQP